MIATAEAIRHLIAVPYVLLGVAFIRWARPVARLFASAHRWLHQSDRFGGWVYDEQVGPWFIRLVGAAFVGFSLYWAIVGTG